MALDGNQDSIEMPPIIRGATWRKVFKLTSDGTTGINISFWLGSGKGVRCKFRPEPTVTSTGYDAICTILDSGTTGRVELLFWPDTTTGIGNDVGPLFGDPEFFDTVTFAPKEDVRKPVKIKVELVPEYTK
jgi:hypothetical protein